MRKQRIDNVRLKSLRKKFVQQDISIQADSSTYQL